MIFKSKVNIDYNLDKIAPYISPLFPVLWEPSVERLMKAEVNKEEIIMVKNINRLWNEQIKIIGAGAFAAAMALLMVTVRYAWYFL